MNYTYHIVAAACFGLFYLIKRRVREYREEIGEIREQARHYEDHGV